MPAVFTVLFDSCVLYPAALRDLLMSLATTGLFRARWSPHIHDEWIRAVLENHRDNPNVTRQRLERTRRLMDENVLDCVVSGYEKLIATITLPDADDRHVVAAAIRASADVIVTYNLKHFPEGVLQHYDMCAQHPDEFVSHLLELDSAVVCLAAKSHRARLRHPEMAVDQYLESLARQDLTQTVASFKTYRDLL